MPFVKARCENCNGVLDVDNSLRAAICPYCNTPYVVQDAINNYITHNTYNVQAETIVMQEQSRQMEYLDAGDTYLRFKQWGDALRSFDEACKIAPGDYRCWLGCARAETYEDTRNYSGLTFPELISIISRLSGYFRKALLTVPEEQKAAVQRSKDAMLSRVFGAANEKAEGVRSAVKEIKNMQNEIERLNREISMAEDSLEPGMSGDFPGIIDRPTIVTILAFVISAVIALFEGLSGSVGVGTSILIFLVWGVLLAIAFNLLRVIIRGVMRGAARASQSAASRRAKEVGHSNEGKRATIKELDSKIKACLERCGGKSPEELEQALNSLDVFMKAV